MYPLHFPASIDPTCSGYVVTDLGIPCQDHNSLWGNIDSQSRHLPSQPERTCISCTGRRWLSPSILWWLSKSSLLAIWYASQGWLEVICDCERRISDAEINVYRCNINSRSKPSSLLFSPSSDLVCPPSVLILLFLLLGLSLTSATSSLHSVKVAHHVALNSCILSASIHGSSHWASTTALPAYR